MLQGCPARLKEDSFGKRLSREGNGSDIEALTGRVCVQ